PEAFVSIWGKESFVSIAMRDNFRSCVEIQNYSNLLCDDTCDLVNTGEHSTDGRVLLLQTTSEKWPDDVIELLEEGQTTALLRYSNANAQSNAKLLSDAGREFIYIPQAPIAEITTNAAWLYMAIARFSIIERFSVYDFINEIPAEGENNRKNVRVVKDKLDAIISCIDEQSFTDAVQALALYLDCIVQNNHINKLYETITHESFHPAIIQDIAGDVSITFHSSKGLEFDQVVIFAEDYRLYESTGIYNHYVASTRAKKCLIIVDNQSRNSRQFVTNLNDLIVKRGFSFESILTVIS
ncbi:ATP-dependent helicase, partial [Ruminococcaceae bacterium OttesenSCG-928-I18]|nr:ATP-dependent helicase [Ruminococcaceae bacterium OttesenSCG-928-I18]